MQTMQAHRSYSQTSTQLQQQHKKQVLSLLFPRYQPPFQAPCDLLHNLYEHYNPTYHKQYLLNYAFNNHHCQMVVIYKRFLREREGAAEELRISKFYQNQFFPKLDDIGRSRGNVSQYKGRTAGQVDQALYVELDSIFIEYGFIPHLERFLTFFPRFLQKQRLLEKQLFQNTKLDQETAYFIGLLAAAETGCPYMIDRMTIKFLSKGGHISWIKNQKYPKRVGEIFNLNRKLIRNVWQINSDDFQQLIQDGHWSLNELALVIQILSFVQSQCSIALALGLQSQQKNSIIQTFKIQQYIEHYRLLISQSETQNKVPWKSVLQQFRQIIETKDLLQGTNQTSNKRNSQKQGKSSSSQEQPLIFSYMKEIGNQLTQQKLVTQVISQLDFLMPQFTPIQKRRDNKFNQLTCVDFNFQLKAFRRLQTITLVNQSTKKIQLWIQQAEVMEAGSFGNQKMAKTKQFRKAQRYYAENLCGFSHPQFDYKKYSNVLTMPLKYYIRILMLSPLHMNRRILNEINHEKGQVQLFDLGHTAILIAVAKLKLILNFTTFHFDN